MSGEAEGECWDELSSFVASHWVIEHHILFGQLQQHRVIEELADTDILAQTLEEKRDDDEIWCIFKLNKLIDISEISNMSYFAPAGFDHKLSGQMRGRLRL